MLSANDGPPASRPFTVALIGADGSGKTTVARRVQGELGVRIRYIYMGVSRESSSHMLPTTRLIRRVKRWRGAPPDTAGPPEWPETNVEAPRRGPRHLLSPLRTAGRLVNQLAEETYRARLAARWLRQGAIVVFDRHFFADYHMYDIARGRRRPLDRRIHGLFLSSLLPKPDLVVFLDAPAETLLARKGEGTIERLERRRLEYLELGRVTPHFAVIDASRPLDEVTADVKTLIESFGATGEVAARWRTSDQS